MSTNMLRGERDGSIPPPPQHVSTHYSVLYSPHLNFDVSLHHSSPSTVCWSPSLPPLHMLVLITALLSPSARSSACFLSRSHYCVLHSHPFICVVLPSRCVVML